jgi:hypothetical protein
MCEVFNRCKNVSYPKIEIVIFLLNGRLISIKFDVRMTLS